MTHISTIGAGLFSDLSIALPSAAISRTTFLGYNELALTDLFMSAIASDGGSKGTKTYCRFANVREFPALGTPPNIVNVPLYGSKTSQQIQGQSDSPSMELQLNFIATDWSSASLLGACVGDGNGYAFRFALVNSEPTGGYGSEATVKNTELAMVDNSLYFWYGKVEALQVNPQLTDANTATVTLSIQSAFRGAFTV